MRHARAIYILSIASVGCGLALIAAALHWHGLVPISVALVAAGGIGTLAALWLLRKSCLNLIADVRRGGLPTVEVLPIRDTGFRFLNLACEEMVSAASRVAGDARLKRRTLEIQLKVANAEHNTPRRFFTAFPMRFW